MSATDPNPSNNPSVSGQESWFNKDVRVFEDLYVYGNLYYNFEGTDSLNLDNLSLISPSLKSYISSISIDLCFSIMYGKVFFSKKDTLIESKQAIIKLSIKNLLSKDKHKFKKIEIHNYTINFTN